MRDYELMVVYDPNLDEAAVDAANNRLSGLVTGRGGEVLGLEAWGRRRLAYPIGRLRDGVYVLMRFRGDANAVADLDRTLRLMESVIRHLIVRADELPAPAPAARAAG